MASRKLLTGHGAAQVAAGLAGAMLVYDLALLLGAPWYPYPQMIHLSEPAPRLLFYGVGALLWAVAALAFLARGGRGPLRGGARGLVAAVCWFMVLTTVVSILSSLGMVVTAVSVVVRLVELAFVGFAAYALLSPTARQP